MVTSRTEGTTGEVVNIRLGVCTLVETYVQTDVDNKSTSILWVKSP
jgi:hypothetical protein